MPRQLFGRRYRLQVGRQVFTDLRVSFRIKTTLNRAPNTAEISIHNLSARSRGIIESLEDTGALELAAGYATTSTPVIFRGDIQRAGSIKERQEWVTTLECGDGRRAARTARVASSHAPGTNLGEVIRQAASGLISDGIGEGNLVQATGSISQTTSGSTTLAGQSSRALTRACDAAGLEWSIQRGQLQLLNRNGALDGTAIVLEPRGSLIGSPSRDKDGTITAESYIVPDLFPGRQVELRSRDFEGNFRVIRAEYVGDTHGADWKAILTLRNINA